MRSSPTSWRVLDGVLMAFVVISMATPGRARAQEAMVVSLDYETGPRLADCPTADDFRRLVVRQLRRNPFRDIAPRRMVVRLYSSAGKMGGRIEWRDAQNEWEGERTFSSRSDSCAQMARTIAVATAIQIDLLATLAQGTDTGSEDLEEEEEPEEAPPSPPVPLETVVERAARALPPPPPAEPRFGVALGVGLVHDFGGAPSFALPRLAISVGRPEVMALRLAVSGLGPSLQVSGMEGTAQLERFVGTIDLVHAFRRGRRVQPFVTAGLGLQEVRVRGTAAMPALAASRDGQGVSGLATAGGGLGVAFSRRLFFVMEGDALFFTPSVTVKVGSTVAAYLDGTALFFHGGFLARF